MCFTNHTLGLDVEVEHLGASAFFLNVESISHKFHGIKEIICKIGVANIAKATVYCMSQACRGESPMSSHLR